MQHDINLKSNDKQIQHLPDFSYELADSHTRYKVIIEYDGGGFVGWQRQDNGLSIQGCLENAIYRLSKQTVKVFGAGRTDAGVHAFGQTAHFDMKNAKLSLLVIQKAINHFLKPQKISVLAIEEVTKDFHARFSAKRKTYLYKIINRTTPLTISTGYAWLIKEKLNLGAMNAAAQILVGSHDFSSFRSVACQAKSSIRTIEMINVINNQGVIEVYIEARSFLHNQVRIILGCLRKIGNGSWDEKKLKDVLEAKNRCMAAETAPASGLYLLDIQY